MKERRMKEKKDEEKNYKLQSWVIENSDSVQVVFEIKRMAFTWTTRCYSFVNISHSC